MPVVNLNLPALQMVEQQPGQRAKVNIRPRSNPRGSNRLLRGTALHHQRNPLLQLPVILGVLHALEQRIL
ncbi:hypothetical protein D3C81_2196450 [compost metagenome]